MSTSLLLNGPAGFRFTRPTIGRIGATDQLHSYVEDALDLLLDRVKAGFPVSPADAGNQIKELADIVERLTLEADRAVELSDRMARDVDEAYEVLAAAEDEAERRSAELADAEKQLESEPNGNDELEAKIGQLKKKIATARNKAAKAKSKATKSKREADIQEEITAQATLDLEEAKVELREARQSLHKEKERLADFVSGMVLSEVPPNSQQDRIEKLRLNAPSGPRPSTVLPQEELVPISQLIDRLGCTAEYYEVRSLLALNNKRLSFNLRNLLKPQEVVQYLFVRAYLVEGIEEAEGIFNYIVDKERGGKLLYDFVTEYAVRAFRDTEKLAISDATLSAMINRLQANPVSLRRDAFASKLKTIASEFIYGESELKLLEAAEQSLGIDIPIKLQPAIIDYIRQSNREKTQITLQNAAYFVSIALTKLQKEEISLLPMVSGPDVSFEDYSVSYYENRITEPEYDSASIEAAAQMYLCMVWGDMLGIFDSVDRIALQSAGNGHPLLLEVRSKQLAQDLRSYVLNDEYIDLKTSKPGKRISPSERQMMYRQLFGIGDAPVVDDSHINTDFQRYWAVLMMEVVKYIAKIEENGDNFSAISASKVFQAIEDIQYNLSAYCSGLPKIAAPSIWGELDFTIQRILDSDDVKQQLGRRGAPSFWKVIEQVRGMQDFTPLRNKGMFGHKIISTIAQVTPAFVEDQTAFEEFIANVEAFIVAEDQLAESGRSGAGTQFPGFYGADRGGDANMIPGMPGGVPGMPGMPGNMFGGGGSNGAGGAADEWNF